MWSLCLRIFGIVEALKHQPIAVKFTVVFGKEGEISLDSVAVSRNVHGKSGCCPPNSDYSTINMFVNQGTVEFDTKQMWTVHDKQINVSLDLLNVNLFPTSTLASKVKIRDKKFCSTVTVPLNGIEVPKTSTTTPKPVRSKVTRGYTRHPVRFATYKAHTRRSNNQNAHVDLDVADDKKPSEEVRKRLRTEDINASWIVTFLTFFGIEVLLMFCFVGFGLVMFVVLQFRPKDANGDPLVVLYTS